MIKTNTSLFNYNGYMTTVTRKELKLDDPKPDMLFLEDIVTGLCNNNTWSGQTRIPVTIAQHSCMVYALAPEPVKPHALIHDFSEGYTGDISKPLKVLIGKPLEVIEDRLQGEIFKWLGVQIDSPEHLDQLIKEYDKQAQQIAWKSLYEDTDHLKDFMRDHFNTSAIWSREYSRIKLIDLLNKTFGEEKIKQLW